MPNLQYIHHQCHYFPALYIMFSASYYNETIVILMPIIIDKFSIPNLHGNFSWYIIIKPVFPLFFIIVLIYLCCT